MPKEDFAYLSKMPDDMPKSSVPAPCSALLDRVLAMSDEQISGAIHDSHPVETEMPGVLKADWLAMKLIGARHEKREIVNLVRWLLMDAPNDKAERP